MMTATVLSLQTPVVQVLEHLEYPESGVLSKILFKDAACQYSLFCLASGTEISEHTATRNAIVQVLAGSGILTLNGKDIPLEPRVLVFMPANAPHALQATANLAFLLMLSATA
jgi:quercetin dioxygenase-like cupin family protein